MNDTTQSCPRCGASTTGRGMGGGGMGRGGRGMGGGRGAGGGGQGMGGGRGVGGGGMGRGGRGMGGGGGMSSGIGMGSGRGALPGNEFDFGYADRTDHRVRHIAQIRADVAASPRKPLTADERDDLMLMREEEKLARDVYIRLFEQWGIRPFDNISGAEQAHMDAVLALLEHHGLPDPAQGLGVGRFRSTDLQKVYDNLVEQGLRSREEAIRVGLHVEELDIADLQHAARRTDKPEILAVYAELERGSRNHLRAFYRWKQMLGIDYAPQHLPAAEFEQTGLSAHEICD
ncbi:DUF2202 domain-containing protein [Thiomonas sp.]